MNPNKNLVMMYFTDMILYQRVSKPQLMLADFDPRGGMVWRLLCAQEFVSLVLCQWGPSKTLVLLLDTGTWPRGSRAELVAKSRIQKVEVGPISAEAFLKEFVDSTETFF